MNGEDDERPEDRLADTLADYDESLASGRADPERLDTTVDPALLPDLRRAEAFLWLVEQAWPRSAPAASRGDPSGAWVLDGRGLPGSPEVGASRFGRFEILGTLGQGGLGIVLLAWDPGLRRKVALKVPQPEALVTPESRRRFLREAHAAAGLDHPNIVPVYESGTVGAVLYIAAALCEGPDLSKWMDARPGPVPIEHAARLLVTLADAVQHAHERGVLHRDLKPSNVLLQPQPGPGAGIYATDRPLSELVPRITDFSLAKVAGLPGDSTRSGVPLGSPPYMAPEQAEGRLKEIGPATDVYALGCVLYELLTGRAPFAGETQLETLRRVLMDEPTRPRQLRPDVPPDLEGIVLRCLEKDPARRYAGARELSEDLERFLKGTPTLARPPGPAGHARRWIRRHRRTTIVSTLVAAAAVVIAEGWHRSSRQVEEVLRTARQREDEARQQRDIGRRRQYVADIRQADRLIRTLQSPLADDLLEQYRPRPGGEDLREFAWHHLRRRAHTEDRTLDGHRGDVYSVAFSPKGELLASAGKDGRIRLWDTSSWKLIRDFAAHDTEVNSADFSPDGSSLATAGDDGRVKLWDLGTAQPLRIWEGHPGSESCVRFTPDGARLVSSGRNDRLVKIWDRSTGEELAYFQAYASDVLEGIAFSPDGSSLATFGGGSEARLWDLKTLKPILSLGGHNSIQQAAFSHRGTRLATVDQGDSAVRVFELPGGRLLKEMRGHTDGIFAVTFSADDETIITGSKDATIRLWDESTGASRGAHVGHRDWVWGLTLSPDGKTLASASRDGTVKIWKPVPRHDHLFIPVPRIDSFTLPEHGGPLVALEFDPWAISRWDPDTGRQLGRVQLELEWTRERHGRAFSRDGHTVAVWSRRDAISLIDTTSGRLIQSIDQFPAPLYFYRFFPDDRTLMLVFDQLVGGESITWLCDVSGGGKRIIPTRELFTPRIMPWGQLMGSLGGESGLLGSAIKAGEASADFNPQPQAAQNAEANHDLSYPPRLLDRLFLDVENLIIHPQRSISGRIETKGHNWARTMLSSPDGSTVASVMTYSPREIQFRDPHDLSPVATLLGHTGEVENLSFSADSRTLASSDGEHTAIRLWHVATHQELMMVGEGLGGVTLSQFSPDGRILAGQVTAPDGTRGISLWHAPDDQSLMDSIGR